MNKKDITPEDIQNILIRDREEKHRMTIIKSFRNPNSLKRLSVRQVEYLSNEFCKPGGDYNNERETKKLDSFLKNLKFFKRFDVHVRKMIYRNSDLI